MPAIRLTFETTAKFAIRTGLIGLQFSDLHNLTNAAA
jgi:hypothetical protein